MFSLNLCNDFSNPCLDIANLLFYGVLEAKLPIKDVLCTLIAPSYLFIYSLSV